MNYWLQLFTGTTWDEFRKAGGTTTGFRQRRKPVVEKIQPGDILLCYLTGVMRWVGALEVLGKSSNTHSLWCQRDFPICLDVKPLILLNAEHGVPMQQLEGQVDFYTGPHDAGKFKGFVRGSPNLFKRRQDGDLILRKLQEADREPITRPVDARKLARQPMFKAEQHSGKMHVKTLVTVPETADLEDARPQQQEERSQHTEIQHLLIKLGADMGLKVWVARNDRSRVHNYGSVPHMLEELPLQFNEATQRTIELIDVLWLKNNSIVAAFEVESTTSIYSGLLRMSDLLALQPNLDIRLYLVAPDERREKVAQEILRPTFKLREKPLPEVCGYLSFSALRQHVEGIYKLRLEKSLSPDFLQSLAEYFASSSSSDQ
ncbi:MAG: hypothetical protein RMM29_06795 [Planctomycetota bacterium]|nr:hypothetical protein [Planctomycetota bacterium]MDW8373337.1 hypothetical protein [Planctomycetota bacterium]